MKKVTDFLKPNILIILGALLFLFFMNYLSLQGGGLAIGIYAVVMSAYYLTIGILGVIIGSKFSPMLRKVFEVISVCLFAVFMFTALLIGTINAAQIDGYMGPTAWIIAVLSMIASLALAVIYPLAKFMNKKGLVNFAYLFSAIFALVLLLDILFDGRGDAINLGGINIILTVIYAVFTFYLFNSIEKVEEAPKEVAAPKEEKEEPKEEAPAEEENKEPEAKPEQ